MRNFNGNATAYDFTTIHYPGVLSNCEACHVSGTYEEPVFNAAVTSNVVFDRESAEPGDNDRVTSPFAASCVGCHNSTATIDHMEASGGFVREKRSEILSTENGCVHGEEKRVRPDKRGNACKGKRVRPDKRGNGRGKKGRFCSKKEKGSGLTNGEVKKREGKGVRPDKRGYGG